MRAAALGAALVAVAGCGTSEGEGGDIEADPSSGVASTPVDPALLECGDPDLADPVLQLTDADLTVAQWEMPAGFVETFRYHEDNPVERLEHFWVAEPQTDPVDRNVLVVAVYSGLDWGDEIDECGRVPTSAVENRLAQYVESGSELVETEALSAPEPIEIAGLPALQQEVAVEGQDSAGVVYGYDYQGYWLFSRADLVHVYCQWTDEANAAPIVAGCTELLESLDIPGS